MEKLEYITLPNPKGRHIVKTQQQLATLQFWERVKYAQYILTIIRKQYPELIPDECPYCNREARRIEGHHDDYFQPLRVCFMCNICHCEQRKQEKEERQPSYSRRWNNFWFNPKK